MEKIDIYTDGSCIGNPGPGGWSFVIKYTNQKIKEFSGSENLTTNNRMELTAAINAIKFFKKKTILNIYTDSKYLKNGITLWIKTWKLNDWKTSNKKDVKNLDLWKILEKETLKHKINWNWVKAHNENVLNEKADNLARKAIKI
tara:strand:+ start:103 stop:534 length:432 start_codon:yes stop_codon:yes gene_type:complete